MPQTMAHTFHTVIIPVKIRVKTILKGIDMSFDPNIDPLLGFWSIDLKCDSRARQKKKKKKRKRKRSSHHRLTAILTVQCNIRYTLSVYRSHPRL
ncbi:hypothetical protein BaRGS_00010287 [Batillaria attramentaria]|uniref:Uncharacterized protein n=1 Tax=Batillaria attramentaria TaxID=370345 RepID=A0ABD0LHW1_9CAEN